MSGNTFSVSSENVISRRWRSLTQKQVILGWLTSGYRTNINTLFKEKYEPVKKNPFNDFKICLRAQRLVEIKEHNWFIVRSRIVQFFLSRIVTEPELPRFVFSSSLPMNSDGLTTNSHIATPILLRARKVAVVAISQLEFSHCNDSHHLFRLYTYW
jgi:hypothetical protein